MLSKRVVCCSRYICKHVTDVDSRRSYVANNWSDLGLHPALVQRLADVGFNVPTNIQSRAIPPVIRGEHTICHGETGSGKTLCYLLPLLHRLLLEQEHTNSGLVEKSASRLDTGFRRVQSLAFVPTPELGHQIKQMFEHVRPIELGKTTPHLWEGLRQGRSHIDTHSPLILTTFSKLKDYDYYKLFGHIPSIVLDEADVYHTAGLKHVTFRILGELVDPLRYMKVTKQLPKPKQLVYVAATLNTLQKEGGGNNLNTWLKFHHITPVHARTANSHFLPDTLSVSWRYVADTDFTREIFHHIEQIYCSGEKYTPEENIPEGYAELKDQGIRTHNIPIHIPDGISPIDTEITYPDKKVLIFLNSAESVDVLYKCIINYLKSSPIKSVRDFSRSVYRLSGSLNREERAAVIKRIQRGRIRILVASDVASRGLDIPGLDMVINAQLPVDPVGYLHRAGRTARMGLKGQVLNFLSVHDITLYNKIWDVTHRKVPNFDNAFKENSRVDENNMSPRTEQFVRPKKRVKGHNHSSRDTWLNDSNSSKFVSKIYRSEFEIK